MGLALHTGKCPARCGNDYGHAIDIYGLKLCIQEENACVLGNAVGTCNSSVPVCGDALCQSSLTVSSFVVSLLTLSCR